MKKKDKEVDQIVEEEVDDKAEAKAKRKEGAERRRSAKKKDKIARWGGFILLVMVVLVGFILWVMGEMNL